MELDPVQERVVTDGTGVSGSPAEGLEVSLAGAAQIEIIDGGEGDELDRVDLDHRGPDRVPAARPYLRPPPEPERDSEVTRDHGGPQFLAEIHSG